MKYLFIGTFNFIAFSVMTLFAIVIGSFDFLWDLKFTNEFILAYGKMIKSAFTDTKNFFYQFFTESVFETA